MQARRAKLDTIGASLRVKFSRCVARLSDIIVIFSGIFGFSKVPFVIIDAGRGFSRREVEYIDNGI